MATTPSPDRRTESSRRQLDDRAIGLQVRWGQESTAVCSVSGGQSTRSTHLYRRPRNGHSLSVETRVASLRPDRQLPSPSPSRRPMGGRANRLRRCDGRRCLPSGHCDRKRERSNDPRTPALEPKFRHDFAKELVLRAQQRVRLDPSDEVDQAILSVFLDRQAPLDRRPWSTRPCRGRLVRSIVIPVLRP